MWTQHACSLSLRWNTASSHIVFISSNCLWAANLGHPVQEETDVPAPVEIYGRSKLEGENVLRGFFHKLDVVIFRVPTIMDEGRLGLLAILYEFIDDNKTVWVVGDGLNQYQFIYADDLCTACILGSSYGKSGLFHLGSEDVKGMAAGVRIGHPRERQQEQGAFAAEGADHRGDDAGAQAARVAAGAVPLQDDRGELRL